MRNLLRASFGAFFLCGGIANAQAPNSIPLSPAQIQAATNTAIAPNVPGGITAPSLNTIINQFEPFTNMWFDASNSQNGLLNKWSGTAWAPIVVQVANGGTGSATAPANTIFSGPTTGSSAAGAFRQIVPADLASGLLSPPPIGTTAPNAGSFTTFSASGAVSGAGLDTYTAARIAAGLPGAFSTLSIGGVPSGALAILNAAPATTLTGVTLNATVLHSSLVDLGTLTALNIGGTGGSTNIGTLTLRNIGVSTFGATSWLEPIVPNTESIATTRTLSVNGFIGVLGATRSSDNTMTGALGAQGGSFININDNTAHVQTGYAAYFEARRSSLAGTTQGIEVDVLNSGTNVSIQPYSMIATGQTMSYWTTAGRADVPAANGRISAVLGVMPGGATFDKGLVFGAASVTGGDVLDLPAAYSLNWRNSTNFGISAIIRSDITDGTHGQSLLFNNAGFFIQDIGLTNIAMFSVAQTTVQSTNGVFAAAHQGTGSPPPNTGSCAINTQTGGNTIGAFKANGACAAGTLLFTFAETAANGWACDFSDLTTPADKITQIGLAPTQASMNATMAANDLVTFDCMGF